MALTDLAIRKIKPTTKALKLFDGEGLYLHVMPTGGKSWRWNYRFGGQVKTMSFGQYPEVGVAQARDLLMQAKRIRALGEDPMELRREEKLRRKVAADNSFESVARTWHENWKPARSDRHAQYVIGRLEKDVFPVLGHRPVSDIRSIELVGVIKRIAARGANDLARRCLISCKQIFRFALMNGLVLANPAASLKPGDFLPSYTEQHFARIDARDLPALVRDIDAYQGSPITRFAMRLLMLTFVRTGELIGARWSEFDLQAKEWRIPAERMKMKTEHIVPLSTQAVQVLQSLHPITGKGELLFPGERDRKKSMSNNTILVALKRMGYGGRMTGHGFRGLASTILHERGANHEHIELQLAHAPRNKVSAAYNHAKYLEQRKVMMQEWADYVDNCVRAEATAGQLRRVA